MTNNMCINMSEVGTDANHCLGRTHPNQGKDRRIKYHRAGHLHRQPKNLSHDMGVPLHWVALMVDPRTEALWLFQLNVGSPHLQLGCVLTNRLQQ
jgi:hypothetical protein